MVLSGASPSINQSPSPVPTSRSGTAGSDVTPAVRAVGAASSRSADTVTTLPGIYSTSPAVNHNRAGATNALLADIGSLHHDEGIVSDRDAAQWLQIFRDKLLFTASIFDQSDFNDSEALLRDSPNLTLCITYVTARYVPGYQNLRVSLKDKVTLFMQSVLTQAISGSASKLHDLQALIIIYMFNRAGAIDRSYDSSSDVDFWFIKTTCEAYALRMNLHKTAERLFAHLRAGHNIRRSDHCVKLYLYWLWLFSMSHHVAIVTGTPPTITADASIRAVTGLLEGLKMDPSIIVAVAEAELCLLWYKLGVKNPKIKEWWCTSDMKDLNTTDESCLTPVDIDAALTACTHRLWLEHCTNFDSTSISSTIPDYYFHYTRFCLHTFFLPRPRNGGPSNADIEAIARCVNAALSVLSLSSKIGPTGRDQLRYFSGFLWVMLSYCSSFVLKAIQSFPGSVPDAATAVVTVRKIADFMVDLGLERGHGGDAFTAGQSVLRQISSLQRSLHPQARDITQVPTLQCDTLDQSGQQWLQGVFDQQFLDYGYSFPIWDEIFSSE